MENDERDIVPCPQGAQVLWVRKKKNSTILKSECCGSKESVIRAQRKVRYIPQRKSRLTTALEVSSLLNGKAKGEESNPERWNCTESQSRDFGDISILENREGLYKWGTAKDIASKIARARFKRLTFHLVKSLRQEVCQIFMVLTMRHFHQVIMWNGYYYCPATLLFYLPEMGTEPRIFLLMFILNPSFILRKGLTKLLSGPEWTQTCGFPASASQKATSDLFPSLQFPLF